ncbi:hypothetical protein HDU90_006270 [Geranomyces variabilis]|nr:hypothetical protein HDU90_006270 [Geranomyces variabilis]
MYQASALAAEPVALRQEASLHALPAPLASNAFGTGYQQHQQQHPPYVAAVQRNQPFRASSTSLNAPPAHHVGKPQVAAAYGGVPLQQQQHNAPLHQQHQQQHQSAPAADAWRTASAAALVPQHQQQQQQLQQPAPAPSPPPKDGWQQQQQQQSRPALNPRRASRPNIGAAAWEGPRAGGGATAAQPPRVYSAQPSYASLSSAAAAGNAPAVPVRQDSMYGGGGMYHNQQQQQQLSMPPPAPLLYTRGSMDLTQQQQQAHRYQLGNDDGQYQSQPSGLAAQLFSTVDYVSGKIADVLGYAPQNTFDDRHSYSTPQNYNHQVYTPPAYAPQNNVRQSHYAERTPAPALSRSVVYQPYDPTALV